MANEAKEMDPGCRSRDAFHGGDLVEKGVVDGEMMMHPGPLGILGIVDLDLPDFDGRRAPHHQVSHAVHERREPDEQGRGDGDASDGQPATPVVAEDVAKREFEDHGRATRRSPRRVKRS